MSAARRPRGRPSRSRSFRQDRRRQRQGGTDGGTRAREDHRRSVDRRPARRIDLDAGQRPVHRSRGSIEKRDIPQGHVDACHPHLVEGRVRRPDTDSVRVEREQRDRRLRGDRHGRAGSAEAGGADRPGHDLGRGRREEQPRGDEDRRGDDEQEREAAAHALSVRFDDGPRGRGGPKRRSRGPRQRSRGPRAPRAPRRARPKAAGRRAR